MEVKYFLKVASRHKIGYTLVHYQNWIQSKTKWATKMTFSILLSDKSCFVLCFFFHFLMVRCVVVALLACDL